MVIAKTLQKFQQRQHLVGLEIYPAVLYKFLPSQIGNTAVANELSCTDLYPSVARDRRMTPGSPTSSSHCP